MNIINEEATVLFAMINPVEIHGDHRWMYLTEIDLSNKYFTLKVDVWINTDRIPVGYEDGTTICDVEIRAIEIVGYSMKIKGKKIELTDSQIEQLNGVLWRNIRLEK